MTDKLAPVLAFSRPKPKPAPKGPTVADIAMEFAQTEAEKADVVLIIAQQADGRFNWVGNYSDDAEMIYMMERVKASILMENREPNPSPNNA